MNEDARDATTAGSIRYQQRSRLQLRLVLVGVLLIFGGESFCLLGPLRYARTVMISCHVVLYAGMVLAGAGAVLRGREWIAPPR